MPMHESIVRRAENLIGDAYCIVIATPPDTAMPANDVERLRQILAELQEVIRGIEGGIRGAISWLRNNRLLPQIAREFGPLVLEHPPVRR